MSENNKGLLGRHAAGALSEGAARFERLIEAVKAQQAPPSAHEVRPMSNPLVPASPEEEWARQYQSQAIGPEPPAIPVSELRAVPRGLFVPSPVPSFVPSRLAEIAPKPAAAAIGEMMGKPARPRRSWFGRLMRRAGFHS